MFWQRLTVSEKAFQAKRPTQSARLYASRSPPPRRSFIRPPSTRVRRTISASGWSSAQALPRPESR
jgi:hypothetical protein